MKTILVLTDFTQKGNHAAEYAFRLAEDLNCSILLFNTVYVPQAYVIESGAIHSEDDFNAAITESMKKLEALADHLNHKFHRAKEKSNPVIHYNTGSGTFEENLVDVQNYNELEMIIMGDRSAETLFASMVFGTETSKTLRKARVPVLLVPEDLSFHSPKRIALAINALDEATVSAVRYVTSIARVYKAEMLLIHVSSSNTGDEKSEKLLRNFNRLYDSLDYDNVTFQDIGENNVSSALLKYASSYNIEIVALINRHYSFYESLLHKSTIKQLMSYHKLPLMVLPGHHFS